MQVHELIDSNITAYFNEYGHMPTHVLLPPKYDVGDQPSTVRGAQIHQLFDNSVTKVLVGYCKNYISN